MTDRIVNVEQDLQDRMIEIRRHLHAHPELSNHEHETQRYLWKMLEGQGITEIRPVAGTGLAVDVVGTNGKSNRKVVIRADIDALPISEKTGLPFSSTNAGVMHACGHDAHAAMAYAAAILLHRSRDSMRGTVRLIFQPAEEAEPLGGRRVVGEGFLDDVDGAIGIHVDPYLETGKIAVANGSYTLGSDIFDLTISGRASHAAQPAQGVDALAVGCSIVSELQKIVSRETDVSSSVIVSVTGFNAGNSYNILADQAVLKGTIRSGDETNRRRAQRRVEDIATAIATAFGATADFKLVVGEPPVVNHPDLVGIVADAVKCIAGDGAVSNAPGWSAADDFGFYSEKVPSVYFRLGIRSDPNGEVYPLHHESFQVDENALPLGALTLVETARRFLNGSENT